MLNSSSQHALTCTAFPPIPLQPNTLYHVGRDASNTIVLIDDLVSRFHSSILVSPQGQVYVEDRNSRNGTMVNGNRIRQRTELQLDDKVTIGTYQIFYKNLATQKPFSTDELTSTTMALDDLGSPDGMVGTLQLMSMTELFTTLEYNEKTGVLMVISGLKEGKVYFFHGNILRASFGQETNLPAIFQILGLQEGTFEFQTQDLNGVPAEIPLTTQQIFLEYARSLDQQ